MTQKEQAIADIERFLKVELSYTDYMQSAAEAQAQLMLSFALADPDREHEIDFRLIGDFFYYAIRVMELLQPFTNQKLCV